jgi:hypothetical protein
LRKSYELASEAIRKSQERQKDNYDLKSRGVVLEVGDRVLVKVVAFDGRHKLADKWEEDPYLVISQPNQDIPVYKVQREDGVGRMRILHRNLLLPIGHVSEFKPKADSNKEKSHSPMRIPKPKPRTSQRKRGDSDTQSTAETLLDTDDEEAVFIGIPEETQGHHIDAPTLVLPEQTGTGIEEADLSADEDAHQAEDHFNDDTEDETATGPAPQADDTDSETEPAADAEPESDNSTRSSPVTAPSRSTRPRREPEWLRSGNFVRLQQGTAPPHWSQKVKFLQSILQDETCQGFEREEVLKTLLDIVKMT